MRGINIETAIVEECVRRVKSSLLFGNMGPESGIIYVVLKISGVFRCGILVEGLLEKVKLGVDLLALERKAGRVSYFQGMK